MTTNESSVNTYLSYLSSIYHLSFIIYPSHLFSRGIHGRDRMGEDGEGRGCMDGMEECMACVIDGLEICYFRGGEGRRV